MAYADYRLCDVCGEKAFYDANLNYEQSTEPYRIAGKEQEYYTLRLGGVGDWAVICNDCSTKFKTKIVSIEDVKNK